MQSHHTQYLKPPEREWESPGSEGLFSLALPSTPQTEVDISPSRISENYFSRAPVFLKITLHQNTPPSFSCDLLPSTGEYCPNNCGNSGMSLKIWKHSPRKSHFQSLHHLVVRIERSYVFLAWFRAWQALQRKNCEEVCAREYLTL